MPLHLADLAQRANILHRNAPSLNDKDIFIYEDHRYVLNIIDHARRCGTLQSDVGVTLVMFDRHDDAKPTQVPLDTLKAMRASWPSQRDFWSFVEWDLSPLDDDWVIVGMELGLLKNVIVIGADHKSNIDKFVPHGAHGVYTDASGDTHLVASVGHIWNALGAQGWLVDTARSQELRPIWNVLGWTRGDFTDAAPAPLLLDFDLDCFTYDGPSGREERPWSPADFLEPFERKHRHSHYTAKDWVHDLAARSPFIGIARESDYCGGLGGSDEILRYLDLLLFDNALRPSGYGR